MAALSVLAACGGNGGSVAAPKDGEEVSGKITVRAYPLSSGDDESADKKFWESQVAAFKTKYPQADVTVEVKPWKDRDTALTTAIAGGTAPDVVYMIPDELAQFRAQEVLEPLNDALKTGGYRKSSLDAVTYDGKIYGAPILMSVIPGICDAKVLKEVGVDKPPTTWAELAALGPKFKAKGKYVTHIIASTETTLNSTFYPWVWQAGGSPFDDAGKPTLDSPAMVAAATYLGDLAAQGFVKRDEAAVNLLAEQTVVGRRQVGCVYYATATGMASVWGKDVMITPPLKDKAQATYGTVGSFTVLKDSENKSLAAAWVNFITSDEQLAAIGKFSNYYPPKEGAPAPFAAGSPEAQAEPYLAMVNVGPRVAHSREVQAVLAPELQAVVLGKKTAEKAIRDGAKAAEPVFWHSLRVTLVYTVVTVPVLVALAVGMALLVRRSFRGIRFFRAAFFLPVITSLVLAGVVFIWIFGTDGAAPRLLGGLGLYDGSWLTNDVLAIVAIAAGYASAIALALFVLVLVITLLQRLVLDRED